MKERKWIMMLLMAIAIMASSAVMFSCDDDDDDDDTSTKRNYVISGNASGNQMVPSVAGTGTGSISGTYNPNTRVLTYTNTWTGLTGAPTGGGFYYGASGVNGVAVGTPWAFDADATATGTSSGSMTLTQAQADQLTDGDWYYGYNTVTNTSGEVRGQITATQQTD